MNQRLKREFTSVCLHMVLLLFSLLLVDKLQDKDIHAHYDCVPKGIYTKLSACEVLNKFDLCCETNPYFSAGIFNGNGKIDLAIQLKSERSG